MITNDYWIHGNVPIVLPTEMRDNDGFIWTDLANNEVAQTKLGLTKAPDYPNYDPDTQMPVWVGGAWVIEAIPAPPAPEPAVVQISKLDFQNLLTDAQLTAWNKTLKQVAALTPADYESTDPAVQLLVTAEIAQNKYKDAQAVELTSPATVAFVSQLMVGLGIVTPDEATRILSNTPPAA